MRLMSLSFKRNFRPSYVKTWISSKLFLMTSKIIFKQTVNIDSKNDVLNTQS